MPGFRLHRLRGDLAGFWAATVRANWRIIFRRGISPEMALRLDMAFGGGAETWLRLQAAYDLDQAHRTADRLNVKRYEPA